ncbi:MAG: methylmalonyl-CoA epimerase [Chloroflexi bacterium]|nr:methylmalonyl-CoA epimerase [Chloroflexota bacterium]
MIDRVHHVGVVLPSADDALRFYRDTMGLRVTADEVIEEQGVRGVLLELGENEIELLEPVLDDTGVARFLASRGPTLHHICFNAPDIRGELARLQAQGVELIDQAPRRGLAGEVAFIHPRSMHGVLIELAQPPAGAHVSNAKGFDHVVARVADLEAAAQTWRNVLGLELRGTVEARGMRIGELPCGQCIVELVTADGADSPLAQALASEGERALSLVSLPVADRAALDAEVARYRAAGITLADPAPGALPGTMTATIPAEQAFGLAIQLIARA